MTKMLLGVLAFALALGACGGEEPPTEPDAAPTRDLITEGRMAYEETCAACHGEDLRGTKNGPPFLDAIYEPGHHPDEAFFAAVENGVQPHHWDFGPMPPQPNVSPEDVEAIVAYVRAQQQAAGIYQP